jgi:hypothetical protein
VGRFPALGWFLFRLRGKFFPSRVAGCFDCPDYAARFGQGWSIWFGFADYFSPLLSPPLVKRESCPRNGAGFAGSQDFQTYSLPPPVAGALFDWTSSDSRTILGAWTR